MRQGANESDRMNESVRERRKVKEKEKREREKRNKINISHLILVKSHLIMQSPEKLSDLI